MFRLRHALPHRLLEGSVRLRTTHRLLERLGLLRRLHLHDWTAHCCHRYDDKTIVTEKMLKYVYFYLLYLRSI